MSFNSPYGGGGHQSPLGALSTQKEVDADADASKKKKRTTKKVVDRQILFAGLFAIIVAVVAVVVFSGSDTDTYVVRAKNNIGAATPIVPALVEVAPANAEDLPADALVAPGQKAAQDLVNTEFAKSPRARNAISAKQVITKSMFGPDLSLSTTLVKGERLISIPATVSAAVAGQISAGDHVDVLGVATDTAGAPDTQVKVLATNVPVMGVTVSEELYNQAAGKQATDGSGAASSTVLPGQPVPGIYVLKVPATTAVTILTAAQKGKLFLAYALPDDPFPGFAAPAAPAGLPTS